MFLAYLLQIIIAIIVSCTYTMAINKFHFWNTSSLLTMPTIMELNHICYPEISGPQYLAKHETNILLKHWKPIIFFFIGVWIIANIIAFNIILLLISIACAASIYYIKTINLFFLGSVTLLLMKQTPSENVAELKKEMYDHMTEEQLNYISNLEIGDTVLELTLYSNYIMYNTEIHLTIGLIASFLFIFVLFI